MVPSRAVQLSVRTTRTTRADLEVHWLLIDTDGHDGAGYKTATQFRWSVERRQRWRRQRVHVAMRVL